MYETMSVPTGLELAARAPGGKLLLHQRTRVCSRVIVHDIRHFLQNLHIAVRKQNEVRWRLGANVIGNGFVQEHFAIAKHMPVVKGVRMRCFHANASRATS